MSHQLVSSSRWRAQQAHSSFSIRLHVIVFQSFLIRSIVCVFYIAMYLNGQNQLHIGIARSVPHWENVCSFCIPTIPKLPYDQQERDEKCICCIAHNKPIRRASQEPTLTTLMIRRQKKTRLRAFFSKNNQKLVVMQPYVTDYYSSTMCTTYRNQRSSLLLHLIVAPGTR